MTACPDYLQFWGKAGAAEHDAEPFHRLVHHSLDVAAVLERAVSEAEALMPDRGKWSMTLPLAPGAGGRWKGAAVHVRGTC